MFHGTILTNILLQFNIILMLGSGRADNVAALFEGKIQVPMSTTLTSWTLEAEDAQLSSSVEIENLHSGFTGSSYVDYLSSGPEAYVQWELPVDSSQAGHYDVKFRYALGSSSSRPLNVNINGIDETVEFPSTGSWSTWEYTESIRVYLEAGSNIIRASAIGSTSGANIVGYSTINMYIFALMKSHLFLSL